MNRLQERLADMLDWLGQNRKELLLTFGLFLLFVVFEAFQQQYYAIQFSNVAPEDATFLLMLKGGLSRWLTWIILAISPFAYSLKYPLKKESLSTYQLGKYGLIILFVVLLNVTSNMMVNIFFSDFTWQQDFRHLFTHFFFHKAPIYLIALITLVLLVHYFINRELLSLKVQELSSLAQTNESLYQELKAKQVSDTAAVLHVRIGQKLKVVPVETIVWIEADDYCVRIHEQNGMAYTLRSSLKALEAKLPKRDFIRVHRQALVSSKSVKEFVFDQKPYLILNDGSEIPLALSRLKEIKTQIQQSAALG
jgi:hypothetical protein